MEWFSIAEHGVGVDVLFILFFCLIAVIFTYYRSHLRFLCLIRETPTAVFIMDRKSGLIIDANRMAIQLLGIRRVGKRCLLPPLLSERSLLAMIEDSENQSCQLWPITEFNQRKVNLICNATTVYKHNVWVVYVYPVHGEEHSESTNGLELRMAQSALDSLSELVFFKSLEGKVLGTNKAYERFWYNRETEGCASVNLNIASGCSTHKRWTTTVDGDGCLLETHISPLMSNDGIAIGILGISHDVTDWFTMQQSVDTEMDKRQKAEVELAQREMLLQSILSASPDPIAILNENRVHEACNQPYADSLGVATADALIGQCLDDILPENIVGRFKQSDLEVLEKGQTLRFIDVVTQKNGELTWYDVLKTPYHDPLSTTNGCLLIARDVSERFLAEKKLAKANAELEKLSFFDGLTKVANRRRFDHQLQALWALHLRQQTPFTIMICDIDFFKAFNDHYGHQMGDEALIKVADAFSKVAQRGADLIARYGGEEFMFLLPETEMPGCMIMAEKIHQAIFDLNISHAYSEVSDRLTISLGVTSIVPQRDTTPELVLGLADKALYAAKNAGRNQTQVTVYNPLEIKGSDHEQSPS
ncbi:sensor domain-containing diguanylate cyclase [Vibrio rumoiensis]|nr:diguanylate cyclase [Vibrio rumoiensis]